MVLVLRPDSSSTIETPAAIAAIRDAVTHAMQAANVTLVSSETDPMLRDKALAG